MTLLLGKKGIFWLVYIFFRGIMRGDPTSIIIAVVLVLGIVGWSLYKSHAKANESNVAEYAKEFRPPGEDSGHSQ
ncbi:hypothetical protein [Mariniblastus fucicola]|uniref:Uncharacterized protein n=1 Tax=Mariniblastus fucicola TaxID=980251 RepID=A0A5B9PFS0_9BACT|nr:hypothetical protein [Mariniblastus fucicola]QEG24050.1 hypothetical protein MFFC18_39660 [Mariniblastus fucicola]